MFTLHAQFAVSCKGKHAPWGKRTFVPCECQTYIALSSSNPASFIFQGPDACVLFTSVPPPPLPFIPHGHLSLSPLLPCLCQTI